MPGIADPRRGGAAPPPERQPREPLFVVGAGGLGRETLDVAEALGVTVSGFLDDCRAGTTVRGLPVLAPDDIPSGARYTIGIADPHVRGRFGELLDRRGARAHTLVHPRATIAAETTLGPGCLVLANAYVSSGVVLGEHVQVHYNATVGHDTVVGPCSAVFPGANVSGSVRLGARVIVGANACVLQGREVGAGATVGAGAVVTADVAPDAVVAGVPAHRLR